jgi:hypothetical protein
MGPIDWTGYGRWPGTSIIRLLQPAGKAEAESLKKEDSLCRKGRYEAAAEKRDSRQSEDQ